MSRVRRAWVAAGLLALGGAVQQAAIVAHFARLWVSEDEALMWAAARDYGRLRFRQPNFWGQRYGVGFDAIPAEVFRHLGIGYQTGLPLAIAFTGLAMWWVLGLAALRRGHVVAGLSAFAAPILLSTDYAFVAVVYANAIGRLLAAIALAVAIVWPERRVTWAAVVALGGLAVQFDASAALIVLPALWFVVPGVWARWRSGARRAMVGPLLAGAVLPGAWWLLVRSWYVRHPDDALHPAPVFRPSLAILRDNLANPTHHFQLLAPELLRSPAAVVLVVIALVVGVWSRRRVDVGVLLALVVVATLGILALPRSRDALPTIYYPMARVLLGLPIALWAVGLALVLPRRGRPIVGTAAAPRQATRWSVAIVCVTVITTGVRLVTWHHRVSPMEEAAVGFGNYPLTSGGELRAACEQSGRIARNADARFVLYDLRTFAYACAGLDPSLTTLYPPYERRAWVLRAAEQPGSPTLVVVGPTPITCAVAGFVCDEPAVGVRVVQLAGISPLGAVAASRGGDPSVRAPPLRVVVTRSPAR